MTIREPLVALALLSQALPACRPQAGDPAIRPEPGTPPIEGATNQPATCSTLPEPMATPPDAGPVYLLVEHVGVVQIADQVTTVVPLATGASASGIEMAAGTGGELWLSGWDGVDVLAPTGALRNLIRSSGGPRYEHLVVRAADDVWAATSDIEWQIVHYDGKRWSPVRRRAQLPGRYNDNKFVALAVTSEGAWVSSWNGLWLGVGDDWRPIDGPAAASSPLALSTYRDHLIASTVASASLRDGDEWRPLSWPTLRGRPALGDVGLLAAPDAGRATITLASVVGEPCAITSEPLAGAAIHDLAIDRSGRVWVATDAALGVIGHDGRKLAEWAPGTLPGLSGRIVQILAIGAGPSRLPAPTPARAWQIAGRLTTYTSGTSLANAALELCSAPGRDDRCPAGAFVRTTTTAADGSFRFVGVPAGDYTIIVRPPADHPECGGVFSVSGHTVAPARDCSPDTGDRCELGTLIDCLPFELPPPR